MSTRSGYIILIVGFLAGSLFAVVKGAQIAPGADNPELMKFLYYAIALAAGIFGLWTIKRSQAAEARSGDVLERNRAYIDESIDNIVKHLGNINERKIHLNAYDIRHEIDRHLRTDLARFAEARKSMMHLYSLQDYADVMTSFAAGERYVNRAWSASADGYADEANVSLESAVKHFDTAAARLHEARTRNAAGPIKAG